MAERQTTGRFGEAPDRHYRGRMIQEPWAPARIPAAWLVDLCGPAILRDDQAHKLDDIAERFGSPVEPCESCGQPVVFDRVRNELIRIGSIEHDTRYCATPSPRCKATIRTHTPTDCQECKAGTAAFRPGVPMNGARMRGTMLRIPDRPSYVKEDRTCGT